MLHRPRTRARNRRRHPTTARSTCALVVVHGMGNAFKSQILLEWAEPILERMDWLARDRDHRRRRAPRRHDPRLGPLGRHADGHRHGSVPERRDPRCAGCPGARPSSAGIAILEARWSESFVPMTRAQVFRWAVPFMWRAITRIARASSGAPWCCALVAHARAPPRALRARRCCSHARSTSSSTASGWSSARSRSSWSGCSSCCSASCSRRSSRCSARCCSSRGSRTSPRACIDGLVESIGDVAAWKERPVRASAMRLVVRDALAPREAARRRRRRRAPLRPFAGRRGRDVRPASRSSSRATSTCGDSRRSAPRSCCSDARSGRAARTSTRP